MTADVRQQLTEALDRAALDAVPLDRYPHEVALKIRGAWRWMDRSVAAGLVERDRELLNEWWSTKNAAGRLSDYGEGRLEILTEQVNAAAAFWVGTPECRPRAPRPRPAGEASAATTTPRRSTGPLCSYGPCECCGTSEVDR